MISLIEYATIEYLKKDAQKEGIAFAKKTLYFGYLNAENDLLGVGGLLLYKSKVVFKSLYVLPAYRRKGICKKILNALIQYALSLNIQYGEATCTQASYSMFIKRGFKVKRKYRNFVKVCHENLSQAICI